MAYQFIISHNFSFIPTANFSFTRFLFNEAEHLKQQGGEEVYTFYLKNIETKTYDARFSIIIVDGIGYSPFKATFAGVEFSEKLESQSLLSFLLFSLESLPKLKLLKIRLCPESYLSAHQRQVLDFCFQNLPVKTAIIDINFEIRVGELSFKEVLYSKRHKQLLKNASKNDFKFSEEFAPDLEIIHAFIENSRKRKQREMTMHLERFKDSFRRFPNDFKVFSVTKNQEIIAIGVTISVSAGILYTFYLADEEKYLFASPVIFLISGIYDFCRQNGYHLLDLGIATENGVINEGLAHFKQRLGAGQSIKKTIILES